MRCRAGKSRKRIVGFDLHANQLHVRAHGPGRHGAASQQTTTANGGDQHVQVPCIFEQFQCAGSLTGHNRRIIIRVHKGPSLTRLQVLGEHQGFCKALAFQHHARTPVAGPYHFASGRELGHDNNGIDTQ